MSLVIVKNVGVSPDRRDKKILQACEIGGSIYGRKTENVKNSVRPICSGRDGIADQYKSFYKHQVDVLSKVFEKNMKQG